VSSVEEKFRRMVRELREHFPTLLPVRVVRRALEGRLGETELRYEGGRPARFVVRVHVPQSWPTMRDTLIHEWAHVIAWRDGHETVCDHDPEWALALGRIYQEQVEP
jgi:hypothetical protein